VLKYLLASDAESEAILPVLTSVLQFSRSEVEDLKAARSSMVGEATSYFTTALFGATPEPKVPLQPRPPMYDVNARQAPPGSGALNGGGSDSRAGDSATTPTEVEELKKKVARLRQLLGVANAHLSRFHKQSAFSSPPPLVAAAPNKAEAEVR
jgi:hypothetical protein